MSKKQLNSVTASQDLHLRLCSIYHDSKFIKKLLSLMKLLQEKKTMLTGAITISLSTEEQQQPNNTESIYKDNTNPHDSCSCDWPIIANERAGSWYCLPYISKNKSHCKSTHFKSTDGHASIYNFSLKRMNLDFMEAAVQASRRGQCVILVDASKYKILPDSFNATLPIWCCVLNRVAEYYDLCCTTAADKKQDKSGTTRSSTWDTVLYVPSHLSTQEYNDMMMVLPDRVQSVINSHVILNPDKFVKTLYKPLRCFWIHNTHQDMIVERIYQDITNAMDDYICILCVNCSDATIHSDDYIPGAGDDEQSWSLGLTPSLFWDHHKLLLNMSNTEELSSMIQTIVDEAKLKNEEWFRSMDHMDLDISYDDTNVKRELSDFYDTIGNTRISIGSRRAGRPPECWNDFDAIVNVTTVEYDEISSGRGVPQNKYYLQLPVEEGKRDRTEFEKWLPIALIFIATHAIANKHRVLVHCAQGMDRSVGIVLAFICMFCLSEKSDLQKDESLNFHSWCTNQDTCMNYKSMNDYIKAQVNKNNNQHDIFSEETTTYRYSGIPKSLVDALLESNGKDVLFSYARHCSNYCGEYFATKDTSRIALSYIQQYRKKASPTRKTMQKINRFFMSGETPHKAVKKPFG
jgi:tRNA A64-2'-O-ribosylphosphate transferase